MKCMALLNGGYFSVKFLGLVCYLIYETDLTFHVHFFSGTMATLIKTFFCSCRCSLFSKYKSITINSLKKKHNTKTVTKTHNKYKFQSISMENCIKHNISNNLEKYELIPFNFLNILTPTFH